MKRFFDEIARRRGFDTEVSVEPWYRLKRFDVTKEKVSYNMIEGVKETENMKGRNAANILKGRCSHPELLSRISCGGVNVYLSHFGGKQIQVSKW